MWKVTAVSTCLAIASHGLRMQPSEHPSGVSFGDHQAPSTVARAASSVVQVNGSIGRSHETAMLKPRPSIRKLLLWLLSVLSVRSGETIAVSPPFLSQGNRSGTVSHPAGFHERDSGGALMGMSGRIDLLGPSRSQTSIPSWPSVPHHRFHARRSLQEAGPRRARAATMSSIEPTEDSIEPHRTGLSRLSRSNEVSTLRGRRNTRGVATFQVAGTQLSLVEEEPRVTKPGTWGARIWDSGVALGLVLGDDPTTAGKRIIEVGSGTGIGGLSAAAAGADVTLSDQSDAMALLKQNIAINGLEGRAVASELLWGGDTSSERKARGPFDLICGSDVLYEPSDFDGLLKTLIQLSTPGKTEVLITYPIRYKEARDIQSVEKLFLDKAADYFDEIETYKVEGFEEWRRPPEDQTPSDKQDRTIWCTRLRRRVRMPGSAAQYWMLAGLQGGHEFLAAQSAF